MSPMTLKAALAGSAMMVLLAACGGGTEEAQGPGGKAPSWCGPKEVRAALADGFGGNTWRRITFAEFQDEAKKCPSVKDVRHTDGQGKPEKSVSDINGLVAQGFNALVVFADQGKAVLPALRAAHGASVATVPYRVSPGGKAGEDYDFYVPTDFYRDGVRWATWMAKALKGKGNVIYLGGPPAVSESLDKARGIGDVLEKHPGMKLVGRQPYEVTNWDPALTQKVVGSLLARYPKIDGMIGDFGGALVSSFKAFKTAKRELPAIATEDANGVACEAK